MYLPPVDPSCPAPEILGESEKSALQSEKRKIIKLVNACISTFTKCLMFVLFCFYLANFSLSMLNPGRILEEEMTR